MTLAPVLSRHWDQPQSWTLQSYIRQGGYQALRTVLRMQPAEVIALVKDSGLRGRGGAGFPTGTKWSFISPDDGRPHYLVVNADESEPGTCKDIPLMLASPHALVEGAIIASYAIGARHAFIYVRGEVVPVLRRLQGRRFVEFHELFEIERGVPVLVVTFVALLELARERLLEITQAEAFAPIYVRLSWQPA